MGPTEEAMALARHLVDSFKLKVDVHALGHVIDAYLDSLPGDDGNAAS